MNTRAMMCLKLGSPDISVRYDKAVIDNTQCVGCGIFTEVCRLDAISE